jgi:hypothetical protein
MIGWDMVFEHRPFSFSLVYHIRIIPQLSLLHTRPRLALITVDWVHHYLIGVLRRVASISLAPIVANSICKDVTIAIKGCCRDGTSNCRVSLKSVLGYSIPEMESTIRPGSAESPVNRVKGDSIDRVDARHIILWRVSVAFE